MLSKSRLANGSKKSAAPNGDNADFFIAEKSFQTRYGRVNLAMLNLLFMLALKEEFYKKWPA